MLTRSNRGQYHLAKATPSSSSKTQEVAHTLLCTGCTWQKHTGARCDGLLSVVRQLVGGSLGQAAECHLLSPGLFDPKCSSR